MRAVKLDELYVAEAMQVLLLLDLTRLPESFSYGVDGSVAVSYTHLTLPTNREV